MVLDRASKVGIGFFCSVAKYETFAGASDDLVGARTDYSSTVYTGGLTIVYTTAPAADGTILKITASNGTDDIDAVVRDANGNLVVDEDAITAPAEQAALAGAVAAANNYNAAITPAVEALQAAYDFASGTTAASVVATDPDVEVDLTDAIADLVTAKSLVDASVTGVYDAFVAADTANALTAALDTAKNAILDDQRTEDTSDDTGSQANLDNFAKQLAEEEELQGLLTRAEEREEAIDTATEAFGELGYGTPVQLDTAAKTYYATSGDDLFIVDPEAASTVRSLGAQGEDALYIGTAHTCKHVQTGSYH